MSVYPHLHVLALDGGYLELDDGTLTFVEDTAPTPAELRAIEDRVEARLAQWLKRNGFLDEEGPEEQELDGWWTAAASDPSGVLAPVGARRSSRWEVDARVRVAAGDRKGREQLCLFVARPPFAEAQLEVLDEDRVRLTFRSPMRSGQRDLVLHPLALIPHLQTSLRSGWGYVPSDEGQASLPSASEGAQARLARASTESTPGSVRRGARPGGEAASEVLVEIAPHVGPTSARSSLEEEDAM